LRITITRSYESEALPRVVRVHRSPCLATFCVTDLTASISTLKEGQNGTKTQQLTACLLRCCSVISAPGSIEHRTIAPPANLPAACRFGKCENAGHI